MTITAGDLVEITGNVASRGAIVRVLNVYTHQFTAGGNKTKAPAEYAYVKNANGFTRDILTKHLTKLGEDSN